MGEGPSEISVMRRLGAAGNEVAREAADVDLQSVLAGALSRLAQATGCPRAAAWGLRADGTPYVMAASADAAFARAPSTESFAALAKLEQASDLGAAKLAQDLGFPAEDFDFSAAAVVRGGDRDAVAILLLGGREDPRGAVRPRTLAALAAAADRLVVPAQAAAALARLSVLDASVRRLGALAALGELVSEIVHEVRNPLVSVKTFLQLLPQRANDPEFQTHFFDVVSEEVRRIERLLDVVLQHARPDAPISDEGQTLAEPVFDSVARLLCHRAQERNVSLELERPLTPRAIPMDEDALRQVVLNLVMNALDVTPPGQCVRLEAHETATGVELCIEDAGPGVPPELRTRIFEPFFSTKDRPGGLGLSISRRLVEESGGRISVEGAADRGTRFRLQWDGIAP